ncbi:MAG: phytanoyl-CoA dioxygenase family protein, partial [Pseudomonadota bacterium]
MSGAALDTLFLATEFQRNGFVVLEDAVDSPALEKLRAAAERLVDDFDIEKNRTTFSTDDRDAGRDEYFFASSEQASCFLEAGALDDNGALIRDKHLAINKIGHAMHDLDPAFEAFCRQPIFGEALRAVGYNTPSLFQTMYIFKQPGIGGEVRWHQDASYLIAGGRGVTGVWVALEDADRDNGCLWMQPRQHRSPLREIYEVDWQSREGTLRTLDDTPWRQDGIDAV